MVFLWKPRLALFIDHKVSYSSSQVRPPNLECSIYRAVHFAQMDGGKKRPVAFHTSRDCVVIRRQKCRVNLPTTIPRRYRPSKYPDSPKQQIPQKSDLIDAPLTIESAAAAELDRNPFFFPCQAETDLTDASCLSDPIFLAPPIV